MMPKGVALCLATLLVLVTLCTAAVAHHNHNHKHNNHKHSHKHKHSHNHVHHHQYHNQRPHTAITKTTTQQLITTTVSSTHVEPNDIITRSKPRLSMRAERNRRDEGGVTVVATTESELQTTQPPGIHEMACVDGTCIEVAGASCKVNDEDQSMCVCPEDTTFVSEAKECFAQAGLKESCTYDEQCISLEEVSTCSASENVCVCKPGFEIKEYPEVGFNCITKSSSPSGKVDPAMIGVLAGLALMFIIICVVLRLFSKARFRENRSIFNTPNPRLMNASLFKDSKLLSPSRGDRRGSRASVRVPSRAPSLTSVGRDAPTSYRSPNGSLAKGRRGSALSAVSATGSVTGGSAAPGTPSPSKEKPKETTVAIEAVD